MVNKIKITHELQETMITHHIYFDFWRRQRLHVGDELIFDNNVKIEEHTAFAAGRNLFSMGYGSSSRSSFASGHIEIGRYCSLANNIKLMGPSHPLGRFTTSPITYSPIETFQPKMENDKGLQPSIFRQSFNPVKVGHDVWIGEDVMIKRGVVIGNGAVVGARSVVVKDVPPYAVVAGNPAKVVKYRFTKKIAEKLNKTNWWEYDLSSLDMFVGDISVNEFIEMFIESRKKGEINKLNPITIEGEKLSQKSEEEA